MFRTQAPPGLARDGGNSLQAAEPTDGLAEGRPTASGPSWGQGLALAGLGLLSVVVSGCGAQQHQQQQHQQTSRSAAEQIRSLTKQGDFFHYTRSYGIDDFIFHSGGHITQTTVSRAEAQKAIESGESIHYVNNKTREVGTVRNLEDLRGLAGDGEKLSLAASTQLRELAQIGLLQVDGQPVTLDQAQDRLARGARISAGRRYSETKITLDSAEDVQTALDLLKEGGPFRKDQRDAILYPSRSLQVEGSQTRLARELLAGHPVEASFQPRFSKLPPTHFTLRSLEDLMRASKFASAAGSMDGFVRPEFQNNAEEARSNASSFLVSNVSVIGKQASELAAQGDAVGARALKQVARVEGMIREASSLSERGLSARVELSREQIDEIQAPILEMFLVHGTANLY